MVGPMMPKQTETVRGHVVITVGGGSRRPDPDGSRQDHHRQAGKRRDQPIHITPEYVEMESSTCENQDCIGEGEVNVNTYKDRILSTHHLPAQSGDD